MVFVKKQGARVFVTLPSFTEFTLMRRMQVAQKFCFEKNKDRLLHHFAEVIHNLSLPGIDTDISHEDMQKYVDRIKTMEIFTGIGDFRYVMNDIANILRIIASDAFIDQFMLSHM